MIASRVYARYSQLKIHLPDSVAGVHIGNIFNLTVFHSCIRHRIVFQVHLASSASSRCLPPLKKTPTFVASPDPVSTNKPATAWRRHANARVPFSATCVRAPFNPTAIQKTPTIRAKTTDSATQHMIGPFVVVRKVSREIFVRILPRLFR